MEFVVGSKPCKVEYRSTDEQVRAFLHGLWFALAAVGIFILLSLFKVPVMPSTAASTSLFVLAIFIGALWHNAQTRYWRALDAMERVEESSASIVANIARCPNTSERRFLFDAFHNLLLSLYYLSAGKEFWVRWQVPKTEDIVANRASHAPLRQYLVVALEQNSLAQAVVGGNGPLRWLEHAAVRIKDIRNRPISPSTFAAIGIMFVLAIAMGSLSWLGHFTDTSQWMHTFGGALFIGAVGYSMGVAVLIAKNRATPFVPRKSGVDIDARFQALELDCICSIEDADKAWAKMEDLKEQQPD